MDIKSRILRSLDEIEEKENVRIIHCAESGSRAWGFASPDSDYDVRFIYVRRVKDYLRINELRDVIEWELNDVYDINGWDLKKALTLLQSSNCTLFEWNSSPIIYRSTPEWQRISAVIDEYFVDKPGTYHYLSTAKHNYRAYFGSEEVKLKKYFYVLRPILACRYILEKKCPPPMLFSELEEMYLTGEVKRETDRLLALKMQTPEIGKGSRVPVLDEYIEKSMADIEEILASMPVSHKNDIERLNDIFYETACSQSLEE